MPWVTTLLRSSTVWRTSCSRRPGRLPLTERIGGFLDAFKTFPDMKIVASLPTTWDADTANKATLDMMQAHPEINLIVAANDFEAIGAAKALKGLNRSDVEVYGNDGDTTGMEKWQPGS